MTFLTDINAANLIQSVGVKESAVTDEYGSTSSTLNDGTTLLHHCEPTNWEHITEVAATPEPVEAPEATPEPVAAPAPPEASQPPLAPETPAEVVPAPAEAPAVTTS